MEIEEFRRALVKSYGCSDGDIKYKFEKIDWEDDEDRFDYLLLNYFMDCVIHSVAQRRLIYSFKVPIPEHIKSQMQRSGPTMLMG